MNTNDAKEYLARREIPQLFEVRDGVRFGGMTSLACGLDSFILHRKFILFIDALQHECQSHGKDLFMSTSCYG